MHNNVNVINTTKLHWVSLVARLVKNPLAMQETWVLSLGWEDPLETEIAIHSSIRDWEMQRTEEPGRLQSKELQKSWTWFSD